jgi:hypothetical protein
MKAPTLDQWLELAAVATIAVAVAPTIFQALKPLCVKSKLARPIKAQPVAKRSATRDRVPKS